MKMFVKCKHVEKYCAFCPKEEVGLICFDCIYEYNINGCIPIKENIDYYKELSKNYLNEIKDTLKNILINKINEYFKEIEVLFNNCNNLESLIEKIDLYFELPIELPFGERIKIAINKKIPASKNNFTKEIELENLMNLYESKLQDLKIKYFYPFTNESITISSQKPFILKGFGIPKISKDIENNIEISCGKINIFSNKNSPSEKKNLIIEKKDKDNLTLIKFNEPIYIDSIGYLFTISGIKGISYIDNENEFNSEHSNVDFTSDNEESIIAFLLI